MTKLEHVTSSLWVVVYHVRRVALFQISLRFFPVRGLQRLAKFQPLRTMQYHYIRQAGKAFANLNRGVCDPGCCPDVIGIVRSI